MKLTMPRDLDLRLMRTFATAARCLSMTATADALHLTQGAISQHVKRLEELLGDSLFVRTRSGLTLTEAGQKLLARAEDLLQLNDTIYREFGVTEPTQRLRIGLPFDLVASYFPAIVQPYSVCHPQVEVSLISGATPELALAVEAGEIDLAVLEEPDDTVSGERLGSDRLVWVGSPNGSVSHERPLPVSLISTACAFRSAVTTALDEQEIHWKAIYSNGSLEATVAAIQTDLAVGVWLSSVLPAGVHALGQDSGLPELPDFAFTLHLTPRISTGYELDMATQIRAAFGNVRENTSLASP
ncbi:MAG: LysR family transcriptional regulator [Acidihalobacter sp.]|uniref:LysR family transcriptional regulator n=1 Tax=Acidihalobacter sp. TaxID=1872108 RepID=UPI00307DF906